LFITDVSGKVVYSNDLSSGNGNLSIDLSSQSKGLYFINSKSFCSAVNSKL